MPTHAWPLKAQWCARQRLFKGTIVFLEYEGFLIARRMRHFGVWPGKWTEVNPYYVMDISGPKAPDKPTEEREPDERVAG